MGNPNEFFDRWESDFDKTMRRGFGAFFVVWAFSALAGLALTAVVIWAIVKLVLHFA